MRYLTCSWTFLSAVLRSPAWERTLSCVVVASIHALSQPFLREPR